MNQATERSPRNLQHLLQAVEPRPLKGRVIRATGTVIHAAAPDVAVGEICRLKDPNSGRQLIAEAVGLSGDTVVLTPIGEMTGHLLVRRIDDRDATVLEPFERRIAETPGQRKNPGNPLFLQRPREQCTTPDSVAHADSFIARQAGG